MTWTLTKEFTFEAAHKLPHHDGKCARLHGHSWKGRVIVKGRWLIDQGPKQGMVMDYADIKKAISPILENQLDHHYLNETLQLENPTSEEVACWLYGMLKPQIPQLAAIEIDETCTASCRYEP